MRDQHLQRMTKWSHSQTSVGVKYQIRHELCMGTPFNVCWFESVYLVTSDPFIPDTVLRNISNAPMRRRSLSANFLEGRPGTHQFDGGM